MALEENKLVMAFEKELRQGSGLQAIDPLLTHPDGVNVVSAFGGPLHAAAAAGELDVAARLVGLGARINQQHEDGSPLCRAVLKQRHEMVAWLLERGAEPRGPEWSTDPLYSAVAIGDLTVVKMLLSAGADPRVPHLEGYDLLTVAHELGKLEVGQHLADLLGRAFPPRAPYVVEDPESVTVKVVRDVFRGELEEDVRGLTAEVPDIVGYAVLIGLGYEVTTVSRTAVSRSQLTGEEWFRFSPDEWRLIGRHSFEKVTANLDVLNARFRAGHIHEGEPFVLDQSELQHVGQLQAVLLRQLIAAKNDGLFDFLAGDDSFLVLWIRDDDTTTDTSARELNSERTASDFMRVMRGL